MKNAFRKWTIEPLLWHLRSYGARQIRRQRIYHFLCTALLKRLQHMAKIIMGYRLINPEISGFMIRAYMRAEDDIHQRGKIGIIAAS